MNPIADLRFNFSFDVFLAILDSAPLFFQWERPLSIDKEETCFDFIPLSSKESAEVSYSPALLAFAFTFGVYIPVVDAFL